MRDAGFKLNLGTFFTRGECYGCVGPENAGIDEDTVGLWDVAGNVRFACLIHAANWPSQLRGCMALGLRPGADQDEWGVADSRKAVAIFMADHQNTDILDIHLRGDF